MKKRRLPRSLSTLIQTRGIDLVNTCDTCKWWIPQFPCSNPIVLNDSEKGMGADDGYGKIETGGKFGCIHHESK